MTSVPLSALAINGMYLTGYGNESSMMGGADVAVARDAFAATNNPAGMTQLSGQAFEIENDSSFDLQVGHQPLPDENANPIFAPLVARHYMLGISQKISPEWKIAGGVEMYQRQQASYTNPLFGPDAKEYVGTEILHFSVARNW